MIMHRAQHPPSTKAMKAGCSTVVLRLFYGCSTVVLRLFLHIRPARLPHLRAAESLRTTYKTGNRRWPAFRRARRRERTMPLAERTMPLAERGCTTSVEPRRAHRIEKRPKNAINMHGAMVAEEEHGCRHGMDTGRAIQSARNGTNKA